MADFPTITADGQLAIPLPLLEDLGLRPGMRVALLREGHRLIVEPVNEEFIRSLRGSTAGGSSMTDELLRERREEESRSGW